MKKDEKFTLLYLFVGAVIILSSIIDNNIAVSFFGFFYLTISYLSIYFLVSKEIRNRSLNLYFSFFLIYYIYCYITNYVYVSNPYIESYLAKDSIHFYSEIDNMLNMHLPLGIMYKKIHSEFRFSDYPAFSYLCVTIGYVANLIGKNSIFVQKLQLIFFSSFVPVLIYNIGYKIFKDAKRINFAIIFGIFSWIFFFSAVFLRDMHIVFIYSIAFVIFFEKISIKNFVFLVGLGYLAGLFRPEHGLFFLVFIGMYLWLYYMTSNKSFEKVVVSLATIVVVVFLLFYLGYVSATMDTLTKTTSNYEGMSLSDANQDGIGIMLLKLPFGIRNIARAIYSQIAPFPFYLSYKMFNVSFWGTLAAAAELFWFGIWGIVVYGLRRKEIRNKVGKRVWLIFIIAIVLIVAVSSGGSDVRRMMCVYPAVFILAYNIYMYLDARKRRRVIFNSFLLYYILTVAYLLLKI